MLRISFEKNEVTKNYHVTLFALNQTIVLVPGFFKKVMKMEGNVVVGCREMEIDKLVELGFVFPAKAERKIG